MVAPLVLSISLAVSLSPAAGPAGAPIALDVPYLPQTEELCGGAAVAMVFRYWGDAHADVQQFAPLVDRRARGITTTDLIRAVAARGWQTRSAAGSLGSLRDDLSAGRPLVLLIADRANRFHYIVAVGIDGERVMIHDPTWGPSRRMSVEDLERRWAAANFWSLLILPADGTRPARSVSTASETAGDVGASPVEKRPCDGLLEEAIENIRRRGLQEADRILEPVRQECPQSAGPLRELAGVRFAQHRWHDAAALAESAVRRDPGDEFAWDVLGSSLYMQQDLAAALRAWNHIGKPRVDSVQIDGLVRTRYSLVAERLGLVPGSLLTDDTFRLAERRLSALPDQSSARAGYRPAPDGFARVDVALAERSVEPWGAAEWGAAAVRAGIDREIDVAVPGRSGQGELWSAGWRWWTNRPRLALGFAAPHAGRLGGVWRVDGIWEAQTFQSHHAGIPVREERLRGAIGFSDWLTADLRYDLIAGLDSWAGGRRATSIGASLERRLFSDRIGIDANVGTWLPIDGQSPFGSGGLHATARSSAREAKTVVVLHGGLEAVSGATPLSLWPGAGEGHARTPLARAHPLLEDGVIDGSLFGRRLAYANVEIQRWMRPIGPIGLGAAAFTDVARAAERMPGEPAAACQVDTGIGLRVKLPTVRGLLRVDFARGLRDGVQAVTAGWAF